MLTIAINHMSYLVLQSGYRGPDFPTLTSLGFSSSAEIFFLMSGYMVGMIYLPRPGLTEKSLGRARKIYLYNAAVFFALVVFSGLFPPALTYATDLNYLHAEPLKSVLMFLLLLQHPYLLGVLQVYVLFMLLTPLAAWGCKKSIPLFLFASLLLYAIPQFVPGFNLPGGAPKEDWLWNFNPFAWQFLYCAGIALGYKRMHVPFLAWIDRKPWNAFMPMALFCAVIPIYVLHARGIYPLPWTDKTNLGILRVLHVFLAVATMASFATLLARWLPGILAGMVATVGRHTLDCYAWSIVFTYALGSIWIGANMSGLVDYLLIILVIVCTTLLTAYAKELLNSWQQPIRKPSLAR